MSHFKQDYLADLEPVLAELRRCGAAAIVDQITECKSTGATGLEILFCIRSKLRAAKTAIQDQSTQAAIDNYLVSADGFLSI